MKGSAQQALAVQDAIPGTRAGCKTALLGGSRDPGIQVGEVGHGNGAFPVLGVRIVLLSRIRHCRPPLDPLIPT